MTRPLKRKPGKCSECDKPLETISQKTCSKRCRDKRGRRTAANRAKAGRPPLPEHQEALKAHDDVRKVTREEIRPIVREAITADVMESIGKLVGLTPVMVDAIEEDLRSPDKTLRQRAYSLLARYTLGNPSVAPAPEAPEQAPMQVTFQLPRPGDVEPKELEEAAVVEMRHCVECEAHKPVEQFVGASDRCQECHDRVQEAIRARFGDEH